MKVLSISVSHYPNVSKRKKPLTPIKHTTTDYAYMEVHIAKDDSTSKVFTVYGLSSAPIAYKARITLLYIATYLNNKYAKPLPENILYQNIVDWFSAQALS